MGGSSGEAVKPSLASAAVSPAAASGPAAKVSAMAASASEPPGASTAFGANRRRPGMRPRAPPRVRTSGSGERDSTIPVTTRNTTPDTATRNNAPMEPREPNRNSSVAQSTSMATATPTTAAPKAQALVRSTSRPRRCPRTRRSSSAPMMAPAMKPKPLAAASSTTTSWRSEASTGASIDSSTLTMVMPKMMNVGVHASSRA